MPARGVKITDPSFGSTLMRVSDEGGGNDYGTCYSYWPTFNKDNTLILMYSINGTVNAPTKIQRFDPVNFELVGSNFAYPVRDPDFVKVDPQDSIWSGLTPSLIYNHQIGGLKLWSYDVNSTTWTLIKDFSGAGLAGSPTSIMQMHRSLDDNVFSFSTSTGYAMWKRDTNQLLVNVQNSSFDEVQLDKVGRYLAAKLLDNTVIVYDTQLGTNTTLTDGAPDFAPGHSDNGTGNCAGHDNWNNQITFRNLATPHSFGVVYNWGSNWTHAEHLSMLAADENWVELATYDGSTPPDNYLRQEIFLIRTNGSGEVQHICHHYSNVTDYWSSPRANISRDGKYIAFTSNWNASLLHLFVVQVPASGPTPPVANFTGNPTSGAAPLTVAFTDTSTGNPTSWSWTFGDGGTSTAQSPSHVYNNAGSYTVTLTATNSAGSDGETKTNYITATGPPQDYTCASLTVNNGTVASGDHTSVHTSDNVYLVITATKAQNKYTAQVSYTYNTGLGSLSSLVVTTEGKVNTGTQPLTVYAYNYSTAAWTSIVTGTLTTTDSTVTPSVSNPSQYISGGTVQVRVKVGGTGSTAFTNSTDLVKITAAP